MTGGDGMVRSAGNPGRRFGFLSQEIFADDYRGRLVTFRGELRATDVEDRAGLVLRVVGEGRRMPQPPAEDPRHDPANHFAVVTGTRDWGPA